MLYLFYHCRDLAELLFFPKIVIVCVFISDDLFKFIFLLVIIVYITELCSYGYYFLPSVSLGIALLIILQLLKWTILIFL